MGRWPGHSGAQSGSVKLGDTVMEALSRSALFISAVIPLKIFPPLFNRYGVGQHFGTHVDGAIRALPGTPVRIRTDLSVTLFVAEPEEYDGGELTVEDHYGTPEVKLPAGDMVLYPSISLHHVKPVTRGAGVRVLLLVAEHDPRGQCALAPIRPRPDDSGAFGREGCRACGVRPVDRHLPQPHPLLGGRLGRPRETAPHATSKVSRHEPPLEVMSPKCRK
jgi:hypothetical protein